MKFMMDGIDRSLRNREAEALHKATEFPVDEHGEMVFDEGWVTRSKKAFKLMTEYYKAEPQFMISDGKQKYVEAYIEASDPERDNRTVLYVKVDISTSLNAIDGYFSRAGQIRSIMISKDKIQRKLSAEIEFNSFESVAVAVAMAVKDGKTNVCAKMASIHVDSFAIEETKLSDRGDSSIVDVFNQKIHIGFDHIPMTVQWLEKIFQVFGVVQTIKIYWGYAILQFESIDGVHNALRLNKQLKFSHKNVEVEMEVSAPDGTVWLDDGTLSVIRVAPAHDDGLL